MISSAQISVYPLRQAHLGPAVETVRAALERHGLVPRPGPMSTYVVGEHAAILAALADAFGQAAAVGDIVLTITLSNACPLPAADDQAASDRTEVAPELACPLREATNSRQPEGALSDPCGPPPAQTSSD